MRTAIGAALVSVLVLAGFAGSAGAATAPAATVAQATQQAVTVSGRVTDASGGGVSQAVVSVAGNGLRQSVRTDAAGRYAIALPPGLYDVTVNHGGYQTATTEITVLADNPLTANVALAEANLSNLQVIGRTSTSFGRNQARFNVSSSADSQISSAVIENRITPDLTPLVNEIPGINVYHSATNANQYFIVRGLGVETKTTLDGHPISSGTGGSFLTQFTEAPLFGGVDVLKGAGLNGPTAGQSAVGTVNIRTRDFTPGDSAFFQVGADSYAGTIYTALADLNFLKGNRLSLIVGQSFSGYRGPTYGTTQNAIDGTDGSAVPYTGTYQTPYLSNKLTEFVGDFSNTYSLDAELAKLRYRFSGQTSLTLEFLGLQGRFDPQGGSYGQFVGYGTVPECLSSSGSKGVASTSCGTTSLYNTPQFYATPTAGGAPFYATGQAGSTNVPYYTYYPGSDVRQNQPNFNLDFKTSYKNDTILLRPYAAGIRRLIDGSGENGVPGNFGAFYEVTSNANCTVAYAPATAAAGAKGPCYVPGYAPSAGYVVDPGTPHAYATTNALPGGYACSPATPCLTSPELLDNADQWGFGSPYTTLEIDKLFGYTFDYIHPAGNNTYNFSVDHYYDDAQSFINDFSPLTAGCAFTVGGTSIPGAGKPGHAENATCPLGTTHPSPIGTPDTFASITDIALTGQFQLTPKLELDLGNYFTHYTIDAQQTNPAVVSLFANHGVSTSAIPLPTVTYGGVTYSTLVGTTLSASHYDPHLGLLFRPTRDLAIRATAGSSISVPYANQVSGFTKINQGASSTTINTPNNALLPEEIVAFDLGADYRLHDGTVVSGDVYHDVVHNPWISNLGPYTGPPIASLENTPNVFQSSIFNGPEEYAQGIELSATNEPALGFGYRLTSSFERNYYLGLPASYFATPQYDYNGEQLIGIPYAKGYAEVQYAGANNALIRLGMDYEGSNNEYNYPAFVVFDGGVKIGAGKGVTLGLSVENLTNVNLGANFARAVEYQGLDPVTAQIVKNQFVYGLSSRNLGIVQPGFRTVRFTLTKRV